MNKVRRGNLTILEKPWRKKPTPWQKSQILGEESQIFGKKSQDFGKKSQNFDKFGKKNCRGLAEKMNKNLYKKQAVRVYFSIRPDEWEIQDLYQHLSNLPDDAARAHAIRQILFFKKKPDSIGEISSKSKTIGFKITFSERDLSLGDLHEILLNQPDGYQRRLIIKKEISKIYYGISKNPLSEKELPSPTDKQPKQKTKNTVAIKEKKAREPSAEIAESISEKNQKTTNSSDHSKEAPDFNQQQFKPSPKEEKADAVPVDAAPSTLPEKKSSDFKKLMRRASSSFDF